MNAIDAAAEILPIDIDAALHAAELGPFGSKPSFSQFVRFGVVGLLGFVWDTSTVYLTRSELGLLPAVMVAFLVAATLNWALNRVWTFRHARSDQSLLKQWALYMVANSLGFVLNRGSVAFLVLMFAACREQPVLALVVGAAAGLAANFLLSQRFVFRSHHA